MNPKVLKVLRGLYKIGGIFFDIKTTNSTTRIETASLCNVELYCKITEDSGEIIVHKKSGAGSRELTHRVSQYLTENGIIHHHDDFYSITIEETTNES